MDSTLACLAAWMPRQRWYAAKGRSPALRLVASWDLPAGVPGGVTGPSGVRVQTLLVADESALPVVLYQVPVVTRATATVDADAAQVIGSPAPGTTLIDGAFDPAYTRALLGLVTEGGSGTGADAEARGVPAASAPAVDRDSPAAVLAGEQSNTSIIYRAEAGGTPAICKIFRQLHGGLNPDIELQTALADAGSPYVPRAIGSLEGAWPDPADPRRRVDGSLAFAQEFLPGVEDAWRVALRSAAAGDDFTHQARDLGVATGEVHLDLAALFATHATADVDRQAATLGWQRRLSIAIAEVPALAGLREGIEAVYSRAGDIEWPAMQRIHGDYHLGQVIQVPSRGWVLLDFEGEPLRPMSERVRPDLALRDVAGMLRSFDYVSASIRLDQPHRSPDSVRDWAEASRRAFLEGYAEASGVDLSAQAPLLEALELDKAVYEAIYEARNRPTWIAIPLEAIARLAGPGPGPDTPGVA